jgi:C4-dicarboxylate transporter, DctM subunit
VAIPSIYGVLLPHDGAAVGKLNFQACEKQPRALGGSMDLIHLGYTGLAVMVFLIIIGVPVAFSIGIVAIIGLFVAGGVKVTLAQTTLVAWQTGTDFVIICIPLFVFMGKMAAQSGIAADMYDTLQKWVGKISGGLAIAAVLACGAFGAVTGSSVASVATMGSIIRPELKKYGYSDRLAAGTLTASGSLAILIPPSVGFAFYGILTDTSIAALFIAGITPGIILVLFYCVGVYVRCRVTPEVGPTGPSYPWSERIRALKATWPIILIFILVIGGIYLGFFTPTEASAVGATGVTLIAFFLKRLTWTKVKEALVTTGHVSGFIYAIILSGYLLARFIAITGVSQDLVKYVISLNLSPYGFIVIMLVIYLILGMLLDVFGIMILSIPFFFPVAVSLGIDPIWFGVFTVMMCEIGLLTPPVGVNVFTMHNIAPDIPMKTIFLGIISFTCYDLIVVGLITLFPEIPLWLTRT